MALNTEVKTYQAFRGVDYSASPAVISDEHASDMLNMYIGEDGVLQKRPGWHILKTFLDAEDFDTTTTWKVGEYVKRDGIFYKCTTQHKGAWNAAHFEEDTPPRLQINGIHHIVYGAGKRMLFIHAGTRLYRVLFAPNLRHIYNREEDPGDVPFFKYDGDVPIVSDSTLTASYVSGRAAAKGLFDWQYKNMDVNGDGIVTEEDAAAILSYVVPVVGTSLSTNASNGVLEASYIRVMDTEGNPVQMSTQKSVAFEHDGNLYILDGKHYYRIKPLTRSYVDEETNKTIRIPYDYVAETVEGYIPTTGVNGHYEYLEPQTETTAGTDIVDKATVTLSEGASSASFAAVETISGKRIFVSLILNSHSICDGLLVEVASGVTAFDVGYLHLAYSSGAIVVTSNAAPLEEGDKVTLHIKNEDVEVVVSGEPGSESNPGEWKAPEDDEERNLIQTKQINTFTADGIHKAYYLNTNACDIDKVELFLWTRCKSVNGVDVPTQENIDHVDAGTYQGTYYYYKNVWTEVYAQSAFPTFSGAATYAVGDLVKRTGMYYTCVVPHPAGNWNADHFRETYAYEARDASSTTKVQNEISYTTRIAFNIAPEASKGEPNIRVTFAPRKHNSDWAVAKDRGYIEKCSIVTRFGYFNNNRFWFSGNYEHKNWDFMSAVDDPTYFPNTGWTKIGSDLTAIQGYLHYGTELAIIKEDNNQDATVYMRSAILTEDNNIVYPVQQGAQGVGAISKWCLKTLKDEPLFLAKEGVYAIQGTDATQERIIPNRSFMVDKKLKGEISPECVAETFQDYYIVCNPTTGHCYVADGRYLTLPPGTNDRQRVYEWVVWDNVPARVLFATDDYLFFGTIDGRLCVFNFDWDHPKRWSDGAEFVAGSTVWHKWHPYDNGYPINAYYVSKRDHLDALDFKKTMLNDGGVVVLKPHKQSSASITVTTDKGSWFVDQVFTDSDEPSVVIPIRKRFKNFDSIQTRIENKEINEGLSILGLQYRYAITTNRR